MVVDEQKNCSCDELSIDWAAIRAEAYPGTCGGEVLDKYGIMNLSRAYSNCTAIVNCEKWLNSLQDSQIIMVEEKDRYAEYPATKKVFYKEDG